MFKKYTKEPIEKPMNEHSAPNTTPYSVPRFSSYAAPTLEAPDEEISHKSPSLEEPETILGENICVKGQLKFDSMLRIDGTFEGELLSEGKLIIGPKGHVKADINLKEAYISGKVEGNISVTGRLVLRGHAEIVGDITAQSLNVDEGVSILGHVTVLPSNQVNN